MSELKVKFGRRTKILVVIVFIASLSVGFMSTNDRDFEYVKQLSIFASLFQQINLHYVDEITPESLIESGIQGMLESLDPYTTYIPEKNMDEFKFMTTGKYGGIGALIRKAGDFTIVSEPYEGFPAQKAGIHAGDTLITIDGISTKGKGISDVSELLKGTPNTELSLKIGRYGVDSVINLTLKRQQVAIPNVPYYGMIKDEDNIGYILLGNFTKDASKEVKDAFIDLKSQGAKAIVLDLRGNPGGLLNEAVNIANIWLPKDQEIVSTRGKVKQLNKSYITQYNPVDTTIPLAVLVSRGSASASEIVAGSLQDLDRAIIVGQKSFGKGLVQTTRPLGYNTHLKITTAKYYIPSGRCIQALDYSHRNEDGSVGHVPDSLISEFKTSKGRSVYDGGGIDPDIKIERDNPGNITVALYTQNLIFDYATYFAHENESIAKACAFEISDEVYADFTKYIENKDFDYSTQSSEKLTELVKSSKREGYYDVIKDELEGLEDKLHGDRLKDLETFKKEIKKLLRDEIVSRYYFQKGRIETNLQDDPELKKTLEMLSDNQSMAELLNGSYQGETVFAIRSH
jgi:carboxyl-terminal processing protease